MSDEMSLGEQNYQQFADRYAARVPNKPHNAHYNQPAVLSLLPDVGGKHALDAGCGSGLYTAWLLDHGAEVVAFDVTPRMVEITTDLVGQRAAVLRHDLNQPLHFAADASFDIVVCSLVLDYIADWLPVFTEFARVLKPGGVLVFSCGHPHGDYEWLHNKHGREVDYLALEQHTMQWRGFGDPRPSITFYRRPLTLILNPIMQAGLTLDHILEPLPTETFKQLDPEGYANLMRIPGFLCVRARK